MSKKKQKITIRSSAAEYLAFTTSSRAEAIYADGKSYEAKHNNPAAIIAVGSVEFSQSPNLKPLVSEMSRSKNIVIMQKCEDPLEREFNLQITKKYGWTKDVLINNIENKTYERYLTNQTNFDETMPEKLAWLLPSHEETAGIIDRLDGFNGGGE